MTPAAFAKLCLRLLAVYLLLFFIPSTPLAILWTQSFVSGFGPPSHFIDQIGFILFLPIMVVIALALWFKADHILRYMLPVGAETRVPEQYVRIQSVALFFVGGVLGLHAAQYFVLGITKESDEQSILMAGFDLVAACLLVIDWRLLLSAPGAVIHRLMRLRARL